MNAREGQYKFRDPATGQVMTADWRAYDGVTSIHELRRIAVAEQEGRDVFEVRSQPVGGA
jgi:hypothetical protein